MMHKKLENCSLISDILKTMKVFNKLFLFVSKAFGHEESLAIANELLLQLHRQTIIYMSGYSRVI